MKRISILPLLIMAGSIFTSCDNEESLPTRPASVTLEGESLFNVENVGDTVNSFFTAKFDGTPPHDFVYQDSKGNEYTFHAAESRIYEIPVVTNVSLTFTPISTSGKAGTGEVEGSAQVSIASEIGQVPFSYTGYVQSFKGSNAAEWFTNPDEAHVDDRLKVRNHKNDIVHTLLVINLNDLGEISDENKIILSIYGGMEEGKNAPINLAISGIAEKIEAGTLYDDVVAIEDQFELIAEDELVFDVGEMKRMSYEITDFLKTSQSNGKEYVTIKLSDTKQNAKPFILHTQFETDANLKSFSSLVGLVE
ncbi:hypothetical protein [Flammeovirga sp. EKP202]|uniref:hypothetical protein n=1 Tax=Flammeovirga sp. EKP202 TaxID=2770592 RepID=UPI00165FA888|nr:hypothetical protein [Flammeovirga sp. EKP202]MBD0402020.1 hypothetical protein [Flammeovirga sp. EKP202]